MRNKPDFHPSAPGGTHYLHGLRVASELPLPGLAPGASGAADVRIGWGRVPAGLQGRPFQGFKFEAVPGQLLIRTLRIADILVQSGRTMAIQPRPDAREGEIRMLVLGWGLAALLLQRGLLPLHGSALDTGSGCVLFCGRSGAGKSTLAAACLDRGLGLLDDNLAVVRLEAGRAAVHPGVPEIRLCPDAVARLGRPAGMARADSPGEEKVLLDARGQFCRGPVPLRGIYVLERGEGPRTEVAALGPAGAAAALWRHVFRRPFVAGLDAAAPLFATILHLARSVPVRRVRWAGALPPPQAMAAQLEQDWQSLGSPHGY
jgi:hypothetical protein